MKKIILFLFCFLIFVTSCEKDKPIATLYPTVSPSETGLLGKWYWEKTEHYEGGILDATYDSITNPERTGEYVDFKSDKYTGLVVDDIPPRVVLYDLYYGNDTFTSNIPHYWGIYPYNPSGVPQYLFGFGSVGNIKTLTNSNLILTDWAGDTPTFGRKHFYHK